jgi:hypothetical protein
MMFACEEWQSVQEVFQTEYAAMGIIALLIPRVLLSFTGFEEKKTRGTCCSLLFH